MTREALTIPADREHLVVHHVPWSQYTDFLEEYEGLPGFKLTYDRGRLEVMSPLPEQEAFGALIGRLIEFLSFERGISIAPLGSTTFRNEAEARGLEPDECYYVANAAAIRGIRGPWDPAIHPAPDIAIEVDITNRSIARQPIYATLGVPELWRVTINGIECLHLSEAGQYHVADRSLSFPFLAPSRLWDWVQRLQAEDDLIVLREFKAWIRELE